MTKAVVRPAARIVLLDPSGRVLLQRFRSKTSDDEWWVTPGGGVEPDETLEAAAVRELVEEVGLCDVAIGSPIWTRRHVFEWAGRVLDQQETFFFVELSQCIDVMPGFDAGRIASEGITEQRWWHLDELERSGVTTAPRQLVELVRRLRTDGRPERPLAVDVDLE